MAYVKTNWKDRVVERPNTYTMTDNGNGTVTLTPVPGQIIERGTPLNAENLNKIEDAIVETNAQLSADIDIERKRIDSLTSLSDGSTTGDAELIDIRIGANNTVYSCAGEAVRTQFNNSSDELNAINGRFEWQNLLDINNLTQGYLDLSGKHFDSTSYYYTDFMPFDNTMTIQLLRANTSNLFQATSYRQTNMRFVTTYDANKKVVSESGLQNVSTYFNTSDEKVKFIRITVLSGYVEDANNNTMLTFGDTAPTQYNYIPNGYTLDKLISFGNGSELIGKRVLVLGDSIAYGAGSSGEGIASILAEKYGCTTKNYAVSGATVIDSSNSILQQYDKVVADYTTSSFLCEADYIIFDGGANDMITSKLSELGTLTDYYGNGLTTDNFTGALETLIRNLQTTFPNAKLIYFTNHHMPTRNKVNMDTYFNRAKDIMQKYGVEVVDIYSISGLNTCIGTQHEEYCPDKTHPNKKGYLKFYIPYIVNAMRKCIC